MNNKILKLRSEIEKMDKEIINLLRQRLRISAKIGAEKKKVGLPVADREREKELGELHHQTALKIGVDAEFVKKIFSLIINKSKKNQQ